MTNLQKVIQSKTEGLLEEFFQNYVDDYEPIYTFDPEEWEPDWDILAEEVITSEEVIEASEKYAETYGKSILAEVKEEEREYQENN